MHINEKQLFVLLYYFILLVFKECVHTIVLMANEISLKKN
jgi:hypothetical protein